MSDQDVEKMAREAMRIFLNSPSFGQPEQYAITCREKVEYFCFENRDGNRVKIFLSERDGKVLGASLIPNSQGVKP